MRIGAIEAGGTKFVCGVGNEHGQIEDRISFPTEHPETTLAKVIDYFRDKDVEAMGLAPLVRLICNRIVPPMVILRPHLSLVGKL